MEASASPSPDSGHRGRGGNYRGRGGGQRPAANGKSKAIAAVFLDAAAAAFRCPVENLIVFEEKDPFNPGNVVAGVVCKHEGDYLGSLYITHVNNKELEPAELIYGTPKIALPYDQSGTAYQAFPAYAQYFLANKWNGQNVLVFRYTGAGGERFLSAKSRVSPFASGFLLQQLRSLLCAAGSDAIAPASVPELACRLPQGKFQSVAFELCGAEEPHLVKYAFPLALKPLFVTRVDGRIAPIALGGPEEAGPAEFEQELAARCKAIQAECLALNEKHRKDNAIGPGIWFNCCAVEGRVLYLLDEAGLLISRGALYKIKPKDIEPYHWEQFDTAAHGRVIDAVEKVFAKHKPLDEASMRAELDLSERTWERFGRDIMALVAGIPDPGTQPGSDPRRMLVMVGCPGSGKSTAANKLAGSGWARVNQDEMGTRKVCEARAEEALRKGQSVVVDRCNFDYQQRHVWVQLATRLGVGRIDALVFDISPDVCKARVTEREDHPTIPKGGAGVAIVEKFKDMMVFPKKAEGFVDIHFVRSNAESDAVCESLALVRP